MDTQITTDKRRKSILFWWFVTLNFPGTHDDVHRLISTVSFITTGRNLQVKWVCFIHVSCCSLSRCAEIMILVYSCSEVYSFSLFMTLTHVRRYATDSSLTHRWLLSLFAALTHISGCLRRSGARGLNYVRLERIRPCLSLKRFTQQF